MPSTLGNRFALVLVELPSGRHDTLDRLRLAHERMAAIKASPEAMLTYGVINALGHTGSTVERVVVDFFADKTIGVTTNVPGPRSARYLCGVRVAGMLGWVPGSGDHTVGTCLLTYDGTLRVAFLTDAAAVPEPQRLVHAVNAAIDDLLARTP